MSAAQHTPGPWRARGSFSFDYEIVREIWSAVDDTGHSELVAMVPAAEGDHINADARLIAAAPELLACLLDVFDAQGDVQAMDFDRYRAAIIQATDDDPVCEYHKRDCSGDAA